MTTLSPNAWRPRALPSSLAAVKLLNPAVQGKERTDTRLDDRLTHPGCHILCDRGQVRASLWAAAPSP